MSSTLTTYSLIAGNGQWSTERVDGDARAQAEIAFYKAHIRDVKSLSQFTGDQRLFNFAVKAFGLDDAKRANDLLQKAQSQGTSAVLGTLTGSADATYRDFLRTFDFATYSSLATQRPVVTGDAVTAYADRTLSVDARLQRSLEREADQSVNKREIDYYEAHIGDVKSIDDLIADHRLYNFALKAYGLSDLAYAKALIRRALSEGLDDRQSFANRLQDERYRDLVRAFDFKTYGAAATDRWQARRGTVEAYVRQSLETEAGADDQGVQLALYFRRKAPQITSVYGLLADKALSQVVRVAFGLPGSTARAAIEVQAATIAGKFDIADLKDPVKLDKLVRRFAALWDNTGDTDNAPAPVLALYTPQGGGLNADLLFKLQTIRKGGR